MTWLTDPLSADFMLRALLGGVLVAAICAVVGTWVVVRGMAFLGEAMAHGMLPGVALASLLGLPVIVGAAVSALVMSLGVGLITRRGRLSPDTSIGLLFVGMLALGVIIVSHSRSFAVDLTAILFGDVLAIQAGDLAGLAIALAVTVVLAALFHRAFVALAFDARLARTLGLRPRLAQLVLVGLVTLAVVASYGAVGSLLVVGLLLAPAVAAGHWVRRIPAIMLLAALLGAAAVIAGLLVSWHAGTAAGATIAAASVGLVAVSAAGRRLVSLVRAHSASPPAARPALAPSMPDQKVASASQ
ncbi:ABC transporter permease [Cryobacterium zongtaii]|uniref:ABC transporter permease n=1 Tax=Cryobacterium zongtaii TaxID=1259217 RepID=A0A2S3ZGG2_9MICO|nr:zinc ABC transporter permease AztB [Cryobacterium zongtaii]POH66457.1 ABC transporter permease [Cryobacterium zongtaii]